MRLSGVAWTVIVRIIAVLWFLAAAITVVLAFFPQVFYSLASFAGLGGGFVGGFGALVNSLFALAGAAFDVIIGWYIWKLDARYRPPIIILAVIVLAFSAISGSFAVAALALLTVLVLSRPQVQAIFDYGGGRKLPWYDD